MLIVQTTPDSRSILDALDEGVQALRDEGLDPRYILVGTEAYAHLRAAVAERFGRSEGLFEQYQFLPIVVDPFRGAAACVVPAPRDLADGGVRTETR